MVVTADAVTTVVVVVVAVVVAVVLGVVAVVVAVVVGVGLGLVGLGLVDLGLVDFFVVVLTLGFATRAATAAPPGNAGAIERTSVATRDSAPPRFDRSPTPKGYAGGMTFNSFRRAPGKVRN